MSQPKASDVLYLVAEAPTAAFLTNTPAGFQISTATPNQPETGYIRAVFIKKNVQVGSFSPSYQVLIS